MGRHKIILIVALTISTVWFLWVTRSDQEDQIQTTSSIQDKTIDNETYMPPEADFVSGRNDSPIVNVYHDKIPIKNVGDLIIDVHIHEEDGIKKTGLSCATPAMVDYGGEGRATFQDSNGKVLDTLLLSPTALVLGKRPNYDYFYYQLHDLDGDGIRGEFILLSSSSCNANLMKIARIDFETNKFVFIPFNFGAKEFNRTLVGPTKIEYGFGDGKLWVRNYDNTTGIFTTTFFQYQKKGYFKKISTSEKKM